MSTQAVTESIAIKQGASIRYRPFLVWALVMLIAVFSVALLRPPNPVPASAPAEAFSAERALVHVRAVAATPHPIGSAENAAARKYLVDQLTALRLDPQVLPGIGAYNRDGQVNIAHTQDVLGRLPGNANSQAILLMAHYDSVYSAPGAADDAVGVAAILEAVRALRAGPGLKNDVIVLFTDGEEPGLLGADAFANSHALTNVIGLILNFEARGNKGPSLLFETGANNGGLIKAVAKSASAPMGSSLFYSLYKKFLPNDTDFTVFRQRNIPGLNFAFGEGVDAYHTKLDSIDNLSAASLQHQGSYALDLTRYFGQMDIASLKTQRGDAIFFDWLGGHLVSYPESWVVPGEILATLLLLFAVVLALRRAQVKATQILVAGLWGLLLLIAVAAATGFAQWLVSLIMGPQRIATASNGDLFLLSGLGFWGCATGALLFSLARKRHSLQELSLGGLVILCILSWLVALALPAGSYLLFWPFLATVLAMLLTTRRGSVHAAVATIAGFFAMATALLLFAPLLYLLSVFLTLNLITALATGLLIGILFLLCFPWMDAAVPGDSRRVVFSAMLMLALISLITGAVLSHASPAHPRGDTILYSLNADSGKAAWISFDPSLDSWTSQFFPAQATTRGLMPDHLGGFPRAVLSAPAPELKLPSPVAEVLENKMEGNVRTISLKISSPRNAGMVLLRLEKGGGMSSISVDGRAVSQTSSAGLQVIRLFGIGPEGAKLDLTLQATARASFWLLDESYGLPRPTSSRPDDVIPGDGSDVTIVCRKYTF